MPQKLQKLLKRLYTAFLGFCVLFFAGVFVYTEFFRSDSEKLQYLINDAPTQQGYGNYKPIVAKNGAVSWDLFAAVQEIEQEEPDPNDAKLSNYWLRPIFTPEMYALSGKKVRLMGYMFPLDTAEAQSRFLFGPYPPTCGFHYHVNANQVVEVAAKNSIKFILKPITIEGTLTLLEKDEYSVFYKMKDAVLVK